MRKLVFAVSALALVATAAFADSIADRRAIMKSNGKAAGALAAKKFFLKENPAQFIAAGDEFARQG